MNEDSTPSTTSGEALTEKTVEQLCVLLEQERQACWDAINKYIKSGPLPEPAHSERNGMILAANIIRARMAPSNVPRSVEPESDASELKEKA